MRLITTAIDYTNGKPHIGHGYEKVLTDALARWSRSSGKAAAFMTGVDQHGQKVQQSAQRENLTPSEYVGGITEKFIALWDMLDVRYDIWAATTAPKHTACVQKILQRLWDTGHFYKATQHGFYSVRQEQFVTDKERSPDGQFGIEWGEVIEIEEENYYFKLAEHRDWLLALLDKCEQQGKPFVVPAFRCHELRNAIEKMAGDLCISRPKSRLTWGIELPFDRDFVTYVWFDALVNYISFADYDPAKEVPAFAAKWPALHVIGKDIMAPPHGIYWPIMLKALGFPDEQMPTLLVHGWWNIAGEKMSKSVGNIIDPVDLVGTYGVAAVRYYLLSDISTGRDADFSNERLKTRYNSDLANGLGNLLNRSLNMAARFRSSILKKTKTSPLESFVTAKCAAYAQRMDNYEVHLAIESMNEIVARANGYVEETAPWKLAKDPALADKLDEVLYSLSEVLRIVSILAAPFIPEAARAIREQLGLASNTAMSFSDTAWGGLPDAHTLDTPVPVFPRFE